MKYILGTRDIGDGKVYEHVIVNAENKVVAVIEHDALDKDIIVLMKCLNSTETLRDLVKEQGECCCEETSDSQYSCKHCAAIRLLEEIGE